jgi:hypothetical protein
MEDFRRNIKPGQKFQYGMYQLADHLFGRKKLFKDRSAYYKKLHETLKASGPGKITPLERRKDLSLEEFNEHYVKKGIPVIMEGAAKDWPCVQKWSLEYFKNLHGKDEILYVDQMVHGFPFETTTLEQVIDNIRTGGSKYYRFYPLLERHPEHLKDFNYKWLLEHKHKTTKRFEAFQVFMGGKDSITYFHNAAASNIFVQVYGEKEWVLYSSYYTPVFDPDPVRNVYRHAPPKAEKPFDPFNPNDFKPPYELFKYLDGYSVHLKPGDVFWNPPFYWHTVRNATDSIGVGYRFLSPWYSFKIEPLYMFCDRFLAKNPPYSEAYKLIQKEVGLVHLAEFGKLDEYLKLMAEKEAQKQVQVKPA